MRRLRAALAAAAVLAGTAALTVATPTPGQAATTPVIWGFGDNSFGQLGDGTFTSHSLPARVLGLLNTGAMITQIAAGGDTSAALLSNGTVWVWGDNDFGEFGNGVADGNARTSPGQVPSLTGITQIAVAPDGADLYAVGAGGVVWAWGLNDFGQLGDGTKSPAAIPQQVPGLTGITQVSAGEAYVLARSSVGKVWGWGENDDYQLGTGTTTEADSPVPIVMDVPAPLPTARVVAGSTVSLAVDTSGQLFVWGSDPSHIGLLGFGTTTSVEKVPFGGSAFGLVTAVANGGDHILVAEGANNVFGWGANDRGQLGDGTKINQFKPEKLPLSSVAALFAGGGVSAVVHTDGSLWTFGDDTDGGIGNGTCCTTVNPNPIQVTSLASVTQVTFGYFFTLALGSAPAATVPPPPPPPSPVAVPGLRGLTQDGATAKLQSVGLVLGGVTLKADPSCDNIGTVSAQSPASGQQVNPGTAVSITIGTKPKSPCP